ncbi:MAG: hypothetical protein B6I37_05385 [Desulfobacteraceae bacterium 4572_35.2]|nr:MAG: hypothetical protein B6I37_05385 [Desulfobacteraceae bacterium 4572_35.2]
MENDEITSVVLVGVGGQGILLASEVMATAAALAGFEVKTNEVHGMAQRGGSVIAQIRYGQQVFSPLVAEGTARVIGALEQVEGLRYHPYLAEGGFAVVSQQAIVPVSVSAGQSKYPQDLQPRLGEVYPRLAWVDVQQAAEDIGNPKVANMVVLGAMSTELDLPSAVWEQAISQCVKPEFLDSNLMAFVIGRSLV